MARACANHLAAMGLRIPPGKRLLGLAVVATVLLATQAVAQVAPSPAEAAAYTGVLAAAHRGDTTALAALLQDKRQLALRDAKQRTPLHIATFARNYPAMRQLIAAGADLHALEYQRYDAVTIAAVANDEEGLALLLQNGASAKLTTSPYEGTALIAAAHLGHVGVVRQLIAAGAPRDHVNNLHWTALIEAVVLGDGGPRHTEIVRMLLAAGANRNLTDASGQTALALAGSRGFEAMVQLLRARP